MKKFSWIMALLAALTMVFVGCDNGTKKVGGDEPGPDFTHNLGAKKVEVTDNFQYGHGYQVTLDWKELFDGGKVKKGDEYFLKVTFTADRDLEDPLYVGLVDPSADAGYWKPLTWAGDPAKPALVGELGDDGKPVLIKAGETVDVLVLMTAVDNPTGGSAEKNQLVFMTAGECKKADCATKCDWGAACGTSGHGVKGKLTLQFSEFIFGRGEYDAGSVEPPPPPPPEATDAVDQEVTVSAVSGEVAILSGTSYQFTRGAAYQASYAWFTVDFGANKLSDFSEVAFTYQGVAGDIGWKSILIVAKDSDFSATLGTDAAMNAAKVNEADVNIGRGVVTDAQDVVLVLDPAKTAAYDAESEVRFTIFFNADKDATLIPTSFKISDIVFLSYDEAIPSIAITFEFDADAFIPVTNIAGIPTAAKVGEEINLGVATVAPANANNKTIVWTVTTAGAGIPAGAITENKITATEAGDVTVTATITDGTAVGTDFTKPFTITFSDLPEFTDATYVESNGTNAIGFDGLDGDNDMEDFKAAKFLVIGFRGSSGGNDAGFGGMQIGLAHQNPDNWNPTMIQGRDWTTFPNTADEINYWVIPLEAFSSYDTAITAEKVKFVSYSGVFTATYVGAWLTAEELVIGDGVALTTNADVDTGTWLTSDPGLTPAP